MVRLFIFQKHNFLQPKMVATKKRALLMVRLFIFQKHHFFCRNETKYPPHLRQSSSCFKTHKFHHAMVAQTVRHTPRDSR